jgi:BirA family biotin operon repressor/biotin-[acetyl-CoA-carboxylase] ligase
MIIGAKKIYHENLSSTNVLASSMIKQGRIQEGTVIYTGYQHSGKGQGSNTWESEAGKNLLFSIILYPQSVKAASQFIISKAVSLGIADYLSGIVKNITIKWPNDIYAGNDKIAGILIENSIAGDEIESTVAGIGLNINQQKFMSAAPNPVSLANITGMQYDLEATLSDLLNSLDRRYKMLLYDKRAQLDRDYLALLYRYELWSDYSDSNGPFEGRIVNITDTGRLLIEDRRGRIYEFGHKEVDFI